MIASAQKGHTFLNILEMKFSLAHHVLAEYLRFGDNIA
jgi:hypothetical protein